MANGSDLLFALWQRFRASRPGKVAWFFIAVSAFACLLSVGALAIGGVQVSDKDPFTWDGKDSIRIVFPTGTAPGRIPCTVTPQVGEKRDVDVAVRNRYTVHQDPWFEGSAVVSCPDATVYTGWRRTVHVLWMAPIVLAAAGWAVTGYVRHRLLLRWIKRNPDYRSKLPNNGGAHHQPPSGG